MAPYATSLEHVLAELERIDLHIRWQVTRALQFKQGGDPFEGLYIADEEVEALAAESTGLPRWARTPSPLPRAEHALADIAARIADRKAESATHGSRLRLAELERCFGASQFDIDAILIALAPELDRRYDRIFAYLQDDVTRRRPSVDLILNLLSVTFASKLALRERFSYGAPLVRHRLLELVEDPDHPRATLLSRHVKLDDRILGFLLGSNEVDPELRNHVRVLDPPGPGLLDVPPSAVPALERARAECVARDRVVIHLQGARGVGKRRWAVALASALGHRLLVVDGEALVADRRDDLASFAARAVREAALQGAALYWSGFDALRPDDRRAQRRAVLDALTAQAGLSFIVGSQPWQPETVEDRSVVSVDVARPGFDEREGLWRRVLGDSSTPAVTTAIPELASKFRFTGGEIEAAAAAALVRARWRSAERPEPTVEELYTSCRAQSRPRLEELARKIEPRRGWSDLVLPHEAMQQLHEICGHVRHRTRVFEAWGFGGKLSLGKGLSALFCGPSGTGKTMAAEIMAGELGLELYKIDLSGVVSKYIGETEKNLARVFAEAEAMSGILFFDEADALFGKRSEVKDAHDRYANVETSYLLQRMEEYEGVSILATNLRRNMDDAFLRRIAFVVPFAPPEEPERLRIWQGVFPAQTPRGDDVDLAFLARHFKLAGGNIKNIALAAAFLAAEDGGAVAMRHLVRATRRELSKLGKPLTAQDLGAYGTLLGA